jgi:hypothetical protein
MTRKYDDTVLTQLKEDIQTWYKKEFGADIDPPVFSSILQDLLFTRLKNFVVRRANHLGDEDLSKFKEIWDGKEEAKTESSGASDGINEEEKAPVAIQTGVAETSKESPSDEGKRLRGKRNLRSN